MTSLSQEQIQTVLNTFQLGKLVALSQFSDVQMGDHVLRIITVTTTSDYLLIYADAKKWTELRMLAKVYPQFVNKIINFVSSATTIKGQLVPLKRLGATGRKLVELHRFGMKCILCEIKSPD